MFSVRGREVHVGRGADAYSRSVCMSVWLAVAPKLRSLRPAPWLPCALGLCIGYALAVDRVTRRSSWRRTGPSRASRRLPILGHQGEISNLTAQ